GCTFLQQTASAEEEKTMARVTGIGGVFFLSNDKGKELAAWYAKHLGFKLEDWGGAILQWEEDKAEDKGMTVWSVADTDSEWFKPSESSFMINYRVDDMEKLIEQLKAADIEILQGPEYAENGVFAWIMDPAGNKIELWEPMLWDDKNKR
ncbi:MAG: VOC family protein, partial [Woeseia sp.]